MSQSKTPEGVATGKSTESWPPFSYLIKATVAIGAVVVAFRIAAAISGTVLIVVASFVVAIGIQPAIKWLESRGWRRQFALSLVFLGGLAVAGIAVGILLPVILFQTEEAVVQLPGYLEELQARGGFLSRLTSLVGLEDMPEQLSSDPGLAFGLLGGVSAFAVNVLTFLVVTPYFAIEMPAIKKWLIRFLRPRHRADFLFALNRASDLMANFIVGNFAISLLAGLATYVGLSLIGVPYALALATWVALTDLIPVLGALIGAIPVAAVAFFTGPSELLWSLGLLLVYQQFENFVIAPRVMRRAVDLSPATVIIALLVGGQLGGLIGALLALPLAALAKILLQEFYIEDRLKRVRAEVTESLKEKAPRREDRKRALP